MFSGTRVVGGRIRAVVVAAACLFAVSARAAVFMLDFGATTTATPEDLVNSPYHTVYGPVGTTWNRVTTTDVMSGLLWADGTAASGVSVDVGRTESATATSLDLSLSVISAALGGVLNTGIYGGSAPPGRDAIYGASANATRHVGIQVGGLTEGLYEIFISGRNTSTSQGSTPTFYLGTSASPGDFFFAGMATKSLTYTSASNPTTASWVENENYVRFTVMLQANEYLNLSVVGGGTQLRGFLNTVQIASMNIPENHVPEPTSVFLLAFGFAGIMAFRHKKLSPADAGR